MKQELPDTVYAVGKIRGPDARGVPIRDEAGGFGLAPLTVLDGDGERALPVFTTREKAERGIRRYVGARDRDGFGVAAVGLDSILETMRSAPPGVPRVAYVGVNMGEGGIYPLVRL